MQRKKSFDKSSLLIQYNMDLTNNDSESLIRTIKAGFGLVVSAIKSSLAHPVASLEHVAIAPSGKCLGNTIKRLGANAADGEDSFESIEHVSVFHNASEYQQENDGLIDKTTINSDLQRRPSLRYKHPATKSFSMSNEASSNTRDVTKSTSNPENAMKNKEKYSIIQTPRKTKTEIVDKYQGTRKEFATCFEISKLRLLIKTNKQKPEIVNEQESLSRNNHCSVHNCEEPFGSNSLSGTSTEFAPTDAISFTTSSTKATLTSSAQKSERTLTKSPSLTDLSSLTKSLTRSGSSLSLLINSLTTDYTGYFDKKRNEPSRSSVIHNSNREFEEDLKFLSTCGDKTSTPERPLFAAQNDHSLLSPAAANKPSVFQKPLLSVPRSLPPSLTKMRHYVHGVSPLCNRAVTGPNSSEDRINHARRSLRFDDDTTDSGLPATDVSKHRRSFSDFIVPKISDLHTMEHINSMPHVYVMANHTVNGKQDELNLHGPQKSGAYNNESKPQSNLFDGLYNIGSLGPMAMSFARIPNTVISPHLINRHCMVNPNHVAPSSQSGTNDFKSWNKAYFRDEADEAVFHLVTKYLDNPDMKW